MADGVRIEPGSVFTSSLPIGTELVTIGRAEPIDDEGQNAIDRYRSAERDALIRRLDQEGRTNKIGTLGLQRVA
jgi:hypothetical protein